MQHACQQMLSITQNLLSRQQFGPQQASSMLAVGKMLLFAVYSPTSSPSLFARNSLFFHRFFRFPLFSYQQLSYTPGQRIVCTISSYCLQTWASHNEDLVLRSVQVLVSMSEISSLSKQGGFASGCCPGSPSNPIPLRQQLESSPNYTTSSLKY